MSTLDASPVTVRPADLAVDAAGILALVEAHDRAWMDGAGSPPQQTLDDIARVEREGTGTTHVAVGADGTVCGFVWVEAVNPENDGAWIDVFVHPAHRDNTPGALESILVATGVQIVRGWPASPRTEVESGTVHEEQVLAEALRRNGFTHQRSFFRMRRDHGAPPSTLLPSPPPGVVVRRAADTAQDRAVLHHVCDTSFRDHWKHDPRTFERFWARKEALIGFDPTQWWVAELDGVPVGALIGDTSREAEGIGHVQTLGVLREARGRGIARHLLQVAFADHAARGWTATTLGVDATSLTGATALYRSVGMREVLTLDSYVLPLADPDGRSSHNGHSGAEA